MPMLAPIIIGTAPPIERAPVLAIVTMIDVVVEELWNSVVHNIPINKATKGLLVAVRTVFAKSPPKPLMPDDNPPIPTRNRYKQKNTPNIFIIVCLLFNGRDLYNILKKRKDA